MREYQSFSAFWPHYLREHAQPITRAFHYFGTSAAIIILVLAIGLGQWLWILGAFVSGYVFAWISHGLIEKNKPATFTYPLWSLGADFKMLYCFLTGKIGAELERAGA